MNTSIKTLITLLTITATASLASAQDHDHEHNHGHSHEAPHQITPPNGGRIITSVEPYLEFYVDDEGLVKITFLDKEGNPIAPDQQLIGLVGGHRDFPTRLQFERSDDHLVSIGKLPLENGTPIILSIKPSPASERTRERFNLNLSQCPECDYKEYACICGHEEGEHEQE